LFVDTETSSLTELGKLAMHRSQMKITYVCIPNGSVGNIVMILVREYMLRTGTRRHTLHGPLNLVPGV